VACEAWNKRMLAFKGPAQPSPTLGEALNAGYAYLEVRCLGCDTHQTVALDIVRRPKTTPIHELERYMRCKHCSGSSRLSLQAEPSGGAARDQDFSQRSAFSVVAGRATMNIRRLIGLTATSLMITAAPALAGPQCLEMPSGRTLEAEAKAGRPTDELVEALLRDAEKIYAEGARIVGQRPRTDAESHAITEKDFRVEECHFQNAFSSASKDDIGQPKRIQWTLIRIEQFDNFIFDAVNEAVTCSNTEAGLRLKVSRELLDHAWMELKGETKERDWDPRLDWPETHERCSP
jgi:hypothetical protein